MMGIQVGPFPRPDKSWINLSEIKSSSQRGFKMITNWILYDYLVKEYYQLKRLGMVGD